MYTIFILFAASLLGIVFMLGRKVILIRESGAMLGSEFHPLLPDLIKIKNWIALGLKNLSYIVIVVSLRIYFRLVNFLRGKWDNFKNKISEMINRHSKVSTENPNTAREASSFLQMMSEYKSKIRNIKHRIKQEESE